MLQEGRVWQAEEEREGDRWHRYYGIVWRHGLAKAPAKAIEFPAPRFTDWSRVSPELDGRLIPPGGVDNGSGIIRSPVRLGSPLTAEVWLRNHRGVDAQVHSQWSRDEGAVSLREGVVIRLYRRPAPPAKGRGQMPNPPAKGRGQMTDPSLPDVEIPARAAKRHRNDASLSTLAPTATARVLRIDLRDFFDIEASGQFRLEVTADDLVLDDGRPSLLSADFTLVETP